MTMNISNRACFGAGCYWGTEKFFIKDFNKLVPGGVKKGKVGFMSPDASAKPNPSYRDVCSGRTGYVEVYDCEINPDEKVYESLCKHFFTFHDPTTQDRQGNDRGTQYASAIFVYDDKQLEIATKVKNELQELLKKGKINAFQTGTVSTAIIKATPFYEAQSDHQQYLEMNPFGYCNHRQYLREWPSLA